MASQVLTMMITDIKGFTERTSKTSRNGMRRLLDEHESLLLPMVAKFRGTLVKNMGDAFMVTFESPTNAVLCAVMMQDKLRAFNDTKEEDERILVRIALNAGEVEVREGDVFGEAVNVTARIEGITEADEIYFTESVYLAMNKAEVPTSEIGLRRFRGIPEPIKLYRVIQDRESEQYRQLIERLRTSGPVATATQILGQVESRPTRRFRTATVVFLLLAALAVAAGLSLPALRSHLTEKKREAVKRAAEAGDFELAFSLLKKTADKYPDEQWPHELKREVTASHLGYLKASVRQAIESGDFGLALARADKMMEQYPGEKAAHGAVYSVVEAEARRLKEDAKYEDALRLLEERAKGRTYLNTDEIEKEVLLERGAVYAARANYRVSSEVYRYLLDKFKHDEPVLRETVKHMGIDYDGGPTSIGVLAAFRLAEKATGNVDDAVGRTLTEGYLDYSPFAQYAQDMRALIIKRYPPAIEAARKELANEEYERRLNSYHLLKDAGRISEEEEFRYHFDNLRLLTSSYQKVGRESIAYLREASKRPDWAERKKALGIAAIEDVKALHSWSDYQQEVCDFLAGAFLGEIEPTAVKWLDGESEYRRANAFAILEEAKRLSEDDVWRFHEKTLVRFDVQFVPRHFQKAVGYFREKAGKERNAEARKALEAGRTYVLREVEAMEKRGSTQRAQWAREHGLRMIEEALAEFTAKD